MFLASFFVAQIFIRHHFFFAQLSVAKIQICFQHSVLQLSIYKSEKENEIAKS